MIVKIKKTFDKDVDKIQSKELLENLSKIVTQIKSATRIKEIPNIIKLKGYKINYRIRIGDYRIGLEILGNEVYLIRFLHRKEIYRYFP